MPTKTSQPKPRPFIEIVETRLYKRNLNDDIGVAVYADATGRLFKMDTLEDWAPGTEWQLIERQQLAGAARIVDSKAPLSVYAQLIFAALGVWMRLRIPRHGGPATLVDINSDFLPARFRLRSGDPRPSIGPLEAAPVRELLKSGLLYQMTEHRIHNRHGWRELGLDGTVADFYCLLHNESETSRPD